MLQSVGSQSVDTTEWLNWTAVLFVNVVLSNIVVAIEMYPMCESVLAFTSMCYIYFFYKMDTNAWLTSPTEETSILTHLQCRLVLVVYLINRMRNMWYSETFKDESQKTYRYYLGLLKTIFWSPGPSQMDLITPRLPCCRGIQVTFVVDCFLVITSKANTGEQSCLRSSRWNHLSAYYHWMTELTSHDTFKKKKSQLIPKQYPIPQNHDTW